MSDAECPLTELPPSQCACPRHRGGTAPGDEPIGTVGGTFEARHRGDCARGCEGIEPGDLIARVADGPGYAHAAGCPW